MKERYYQFLDISILVKTEVEEILYSLDKIYRYFKKDNIYNPHLELIVYVKNKDLNDLNNFEIYAVTPASFDGWRLAGEIWANVNLINRYVFEIDTLPKGIKLEKGRRAFQIKTRVNEPGKRVGWLLQLNFHINLFALHYLNKFCILHGGALAWGEKGIILNGPAGSGKSTLTFALAKAGFDFLTDECILVEPYSRKLFPYPISPSFEQDSRGLFKEIAESFEEDKKLHNKSIKCFLDTKNIKVRDKPIAPHYIIFTKYLPDKNPDIEKVSSSKAIEKLMREKNIMSLLPPEKQIFSQKEVAEILLQNAECYELVSNQLDKTIALVKDVVLKS